MYVEVEKVEKYDSHISDVFESTFIFKHLRILLLEIIYINFYLSVAHLNHFGINGLMTENIVFNLTRKGTAKMT